MGETTGIQWTDATWNPWIGCEKVSPACAHCYMFRQMSKYGRDPEKIVRTSPATFNAPLKWASGIKVFTCSWSDFFIKEADEWRPDALSIIGNRSDITFQILTKRPERIRCHYPNMDWRFLSNVWLGVSVENRRFYDRIEQLRAVDCSLRFLSIEPLLGPMPDLPLSGIRWVIVGGESGPKFRPLNLDWVRQIRDRCQEWHVPFFFKQHSGLNPKKLGRLLDSREWNEFPKISTRQ